MTVSLYVLVGPDGRVSPEAFSKSVDARYRLAEAPDGWRVARVWAEVPDAEDERPPAPRRDDDPRDLREVVRDAWRGWERARSTAGEP